MPSPKEQSYEDEDDVVPLVKSFDGIERDSPRKTTNTKPTSFGRKIFLPVLILIVICVSFFMYGGKELNNSTDEQKSSSIPLDVTIKHPAVDQELEEDSETSGSSKIPPDEINLPLEPLNEVEEDPSTTDFTKVPPSPEDNVPPSTEDNVPPSTEDNVPPSTEDNVPQSPEDNIPPSHEENEPPSHEDNDSKSEEVIVPSFVDVASEISSMKSNFEKAKEQLINELKAQYGETNFEKIFYEVEDGVKRSRGGKVFQQAEGGSSENRFKRKMMIKLLKVINEIAHNKKGLRSELIPFIWATGGHSAAAGHGNFYHESYTGVLGRSAKTIFESIGLDFTARAYAMGGTRAAPELALCSKEVFGKDIDALVWDFGMTDGNAFEYQLLYFYRASLTSNRPACFAYHAEGPYRLQVTKELDDLGITALISMESVMNDALNAVPDTFGLTEDEIQQMPDFVQNFRCGKEIEKGDPYCSTQKYNLTLCPTRKYQASWHPGWRWHAVMGYLANFFLIEVIESAMEDIAVNVTNPFEALVELEAEEEKDYETLWNAETPSSFTKLLDPGDVDMLNFTIFSKGSSFCHTAKLPAEIRYKGILTESDQIGFTTYDKGITQVEADTTPNPGESMRLVYDEGERFDCPIPTIMDYKDYFYIHTREEWKQLTLPNDAEVNEYGSPKQELKGVIVMCFTICPWGHCPPGSLGRDDFLDDKYQLNVNDQPVTNLTKLTDCDLLNNDGSLMWKPNADGKFEIKAKVTEPNSFLRISAFIIW